MQELETVNNNIKLLSEMLGHYSKTSSESDKEILKVRVLYLLPCYMSVNYLHMLNLGCLINDILNECLF